MTVSLPSFEDYETFQRLARRPVAMAAGGIDIAHSHGLKPATPHVFTTGTNLVVGLGDELILKIFPPMLS